MSSKLLFVDKVVIVTGAANGLGRVYAREFAKRGAQVLVNDFDSNEKNNNKAADEVVDEIRLNGGQAYANYDSVENGDKIVTAAIENFGRVDVIVNNAGILRDKSFQKMSDADFEYVYRIHLKGAFSVTRAAWPYFKRQNGGRIIFTASNSGVYGNFGQANYAAAKNGLIGLAKTLAIEGERYQIYSNVVIPTAHTRLTFGLLPDEMLSMLKPEQVAPLVLFLSHDDCDANGGVFEAAGGWFGQLQTCRSPGINISDATPELVQASWSAITDMNNAKYLHSIQEATAELVTTTEKNTEKSKL